MGHISFRSLWSTQLVYCVWAQQCCHAILIVRPSHSHQGDLRSLRGCQSGSVWGEDLNLSVHCVNDKQYMTYTDNYWLIGKYFSSKPTTWENAVRTVTKNGRVNHGTQLAANGLSPGTWSQVKTMKKTSAVSETAGAVMIGCMNKHQPMSSHWAQHGRVLTLENTNDVEPLRKSSLKSLIRSPRITAAKIAGGKHLAIGLFWPQKIVKLRRLFDHTVYPNSYRHHFLLRVSAAVLSRDIDCPSVTFSPGGSP